jgi:hypothetical protein
VFCQIAWVFQLSRIKPQGNPSRWENIPWPFQVSTRTLSQRWEIGYFRAGSRTGCLWLRTANMVCSTYLYTW